MTPTTIGCCELYHADCRDLLPCLQGVTVLITDPPYGMGYRQKRSRDKWVRPDTVHPPMVGDDAPFDPAHLLGFPRVILWGADHYKEKLPPGGKLLTWDKKAGTTPDHSADCEYAWTNLQGPSRIFPFLWRGCIRRGAGNMRRGGKKLHPHQKPEELMAWCLDQAKVHPGDTVCDPYMGSASLGVVCLRRGMRYIGMESDPGYYLTAVERLRHEAARLQHEAAKDPEWLLACPTRCRGVPAGAVGGLSRQQQHLLVSLLERYQDCERAGVTRDLDIRGLPWHIQGTRTLQASVSRALRRLEQRGLVLRQHRVSGHGAGSGRVSAAEAHRRSTHVRLLPAGREIAERLTHSRRQLLTV